MNKGKDEKFTMKSKVRLNLYVSTAWFLMIAGTVSILLAIATSYWRGTTEMHEGVFQRCKGGDCESVTFFNGTDGELDLVRILMLIGNFYILVALILAILSIGPPTAGTILRVLSFVHCVTAMICYTYYYTGLTFMWSFYVCWFGIVALFIGLIIMTYVDVQRLRNKDLPDEMSEEEEAEEDDTDDDDGGELK